METVKKVEYLLSEILNKTDNEDVKILTAICLDLLSDVDELIDVAPDAYTSDYNITDNVSDYNIKILDFLKEKAIKHPELRFNQLLWIANVIEKTGDGTIIDNFHETSKQTWDKLNFGLEW